MSDEPKHIIAGARNRGKQAAINKWMQKVRGMILVVHPDGNHEVIEDIDHEVVEPKQLPPAQEP